MKSRGELHTSIGIVRQTRIDNGLPTETQARQARVLELHGKGYTPYQMKEFGMNPSSVRTILQREGIEPNVEKKHGKRVEMRGGPRKIMDRDRIMELNAQGMKDVDIAIEMECARCTVTRIIRECGGDPIINKNGGRPKNAEYDLDVVKRMREQGASIQIIAEHYGVTENYARSMVSKSGYSQEKSMNWDSADPSGFLTNELVKAQEGHAIIVDGREFKNVWLASMLNAFDLPAFCKAIRDGAIKFEGRPFP